MAIAGFFLLLIGVVIGIAIGQHTAASSTDHVAKAVVEDIMKNGPIGRAIKARL